MANTKSAKKAIRVIERKTLRNKMVRSKLKTAIRKSREAIAGGDVDEAEAATRLAARELDKAANKHIIHRNNAARRKSRLFKALAELKNEPAEA